MAEIKFLGDINLKQNELKNAVIQNLESAPEDPKVGQHYFNTEDNTEYVWNGTEWVDALSQGNYTFRNGISETDRIVTLDKATETTLGGVAIGSNINVTEGIISVNDATDEQSGVIQVATDSDVTTGTDTSKAVTPKQLKTGLDAKLDKNSTIQPGTHTKVTYDSKGLITSGSNLTAIDIPDLQLTKITDVTATAAEVNYLSGTTANVQEQINSKLNTSDVINNVTTATTNQALSANMGKELQDQIDNLKARGRYLSQWDCTTGLAETVPPVVPYDYKAGDYFVIGVVGETNYKPNGSQYTGVASTTVDTMEVAVEDVYYYDGAVWHLQQNTQKTVSFANLIGQPTDNTNLANALNAKQDVISDLDTIRSGAALGATALQEVPSEYITETELENYHDDTKQDNLTDVNAGDNITITKEGGSSSILPEGYTQLEYIQGTGTQGITLGTLTEGSVEVDFAPTRLTGTYANGYDGVLGKNSGPQLGWFLTGWTQGNGGSTTPYLPIVGTKYTYRFEHTGGKFYIDGQDTGLFRSGALQLTLFYCESSYKPSIVYEYRQYDASDNLVMRLIPCKFRTTIGMYDVVSNQLYTNSGTDEFVAGPIVGSILKISAIVPTKTSELTNDSDFITSSYHDSTKQDVISDLETIRSNAADGEAAKNTIDTYGDVVTHNASEFYLATNPEGYITKDVDNLTNYTLTTDLQVELDAKQDVITSESAGDNIVIKEAGTSSLPEEYAQIEYLESSGTQYIDTGILAESGKSWEIEFVLPAVSMNGWIGARVSNIRFWNILYAGAFEVGLGGDHGISSPSPTAGKKYNHKLVTDSSGWTAYVDDVVVATGSDVVSSTDIGGNIWLFKINNVSGGTYTGNTRIYSTKIWDGETLVRNFIPAELKADGTLGMYDMITGTFFTNKGTGTFTGGEEVSPVLTISAVVPTKTSELTNDSNFITDSTLTTELAKKQDTLVSGTNIKTVNNESLLGSGNVEIDMSTLINVTYAELLALKTNSQLKEGAFYRITDYVTTTNGNSADSSEPSRSAGHQFDIIIQAIGTSNLCDVGTCALRDGDTYFASQNLGAWQVWYDINNDTTKYAWAVTDGTGKGVIYRMIDEHQNDLPYDFKNIQFYRDKTLSKYSIISSYLTATDGYYYTFTYSSTLEDETVLTSANKANNNKIDIHNNGTTNNILNNNIIISSNAINNNTAINDFYSNTIAGRNFYTNNFKDACYGNIITGSYLYSNNIGSWSYNNVINGNFYNNDISEQFENNTITGSNLYSNNIGSFFQNNTITGKFYNNNIGYYCHDNTINLTSAFCGNDIQSYFNNNKITGTNFRFNNIGNYFQKNTLTSGEIGYNTVGSYYYSNTHNGTIQYTHIGDTVINCTFGDTIRSLIIENDIEQCEFPSYFNYSTVKAFCYCVKFPNSSTASTSNKNRFFTIHYVEGTSSTNKLDLGGLPTHQTYPINIEFDSAGRVIATWEKDGLTIGKYKASVTATEWLDLVPTITLDEWEA